MQPHHYRHMTQVAAADGTLGYPWAYGVLRSILAGEYSGKPAQRVDNAIAFIKAFEAEMESEKTRTRTP